MGKCEDAIIEKEKDVAHLKYNMNELKKHFNEKEEELDLLKMTNVKIEKEMEMTKEKNQDLKHQFEIEMENLMLKNQLLGNKVISIENLLLVSKKQMQDQQVEITSVKQEVEDVRSNLSEDIKFHLSKPLNDFQSSTNNDVNKLKDEVNEVNNQINTTNNEINKLSVQITTVDEKMKHNFITLNDKINKEDVYLRCNLNDQIEEIRSYLDKKTNEFNNLSTKIDATENVIKDNFSTLNDKINNAAVGGNLINDPQKEVDEEMKNIAKLKWHVNNIENILFCDSSNGCTDILIQWKLQNYQYYFDIGKRVFSPIFLTQIKGYCLKLHVRWSGENKEHFGLGLWVCRGSNYDKPLEPFRMPYSLEMVDNKGNIFSKKISLSSVEAKWLFTILKYA